MKMTATHPRASRGGQDQLHLLSLAPASLALLCRAQATQSQGCKSTERVRYIPQAPELASPPLLPLPAMLEAASLFSVPFLLLTRLWICRPQPSAATRRARVPPFQPPPRQPSIIRAEADVTIKPPLAQLLEEDPRVANVLGQAFIRRLTIEQSCSSIGQLLALNRPQLDALLDALRPLPGHRDIFLDFLNTQRLAAIEQRRQRAEEAEAAAAAASGGGEAAGGGAGAGAAIRPGTAPAGGSATPAQRRAWHSSLQLLRNATIAAKRGGDGHLSHLISQQPLQWGFIKGPAPQASAYVSHCRVLHMGKNRILDYGGPRPHSPPRTAQERRVYDPDVF
jgi:hypothetical protein